MKQKTILLVGGGSGGHVVPVFEVYQELKKEKDLRLLVVGSGTTIEKKFFGGNPDYRTIITGKLNRRFTFHNIFQFVKFLYGIKYTFFLMLREKPSIIFSKGGYVSFPIIFWAKRLKIPYVIHESDAEIGLSNKYAAANAKKIFVGFPLEFYKGYKNLVYSGQIIRPVKAINFSSKNYFDFTLQRPVIFITGGSQGSINLNSNIIKIIPELLLSYNVIHQTGSIDYNSVIEFKKKLDEDRAKNYFVMDFLHKEGQNLMPYAIKMADIVIARAGATTIAELAIHKKAMILVPYKHASGDHQTKNAKFIEGLGGALVIADDSLNPDSLKKIINEAFRNKSDLGDKASKIFPEDGLKTVVCGILELLGERK